jgi:hypothetical protein
MLDAIALDIERGKKNRDLQQRSEERERKRKRKILLQNTSSRQWRRRIG